MPSSEKPNSTTWYVVVRCKNTLEMDYKDITLLTTNREEATEKQKEIDSTGVDIGIVEILNVYNS